MKAPFVFGSLAILLNIVGASAVDADKLKCYPDTERCSTACASANQTSDLVLECRKSCGVLNSVEKAYCFTQYFSDDNGFSNRVKKQQEKSKDADTVNRASQRAIDSESSLEKQQQKNQADLQRQNDNQRNEAMKLFFEELSRGLSATIGGHQSSMYCKKVADYNACVNQGQTGHGGGSPRFCFLQFC